MEMSIGKAVVKTVANTKYKWLMALDVIFLGAVVYLYQAGHANLPAVTPTNLVVFALATIRLAHTISYNEIAEPLRAPFTEVVTDSCGAGANVHPKGDGLQYVIGSLEACPICAGTWAALALVLAWTLLPFGQTLVWVLAVAGASEQLHWLSQVTEWGGRAARVYSGHVSPDKE